MSELMRVGITHGDYNGIGYEVSLKALADEMITELFTPVFYGIAELVEKAAVDFGLTLPPVRVIKRSEEAEEGYLNIVDLGIRPELEPGKVSHKAGESAVLALERAVSDVLAGKIDSLVTAPISKEAVQSDRFKFTGHTEFLADRSHAQAQMILYSDQLRVALLSTHLAVSDIPASVSREAVSDAVRRFDATLRQDFNIERPCIAVMSLNPHCGDGGLLGTEEIREITPAINELSEQLLVFGPYAADGFFASGAWKKFDGILAMYHDQGLAPFKALAGAEGVNFSAGLPFIRTSPDHGTGYDIAWKGEADCTSMRQAIYSAIDLTRNRRRNIEAAANPLPAIPERPDRGERTNKEPKNHKPSAQ